MGLAFRQQLFLRLQGFPLDLLKSRYLAESAESGKRPGVSRSTLAAPLCWAPGGGLPDLQCLEAVEAWGTRRGGSQVVEQTPPS